MDYVGILLKEVYRIIGECVGKHSKLLFVSKDPEIRYDDKRLTYNVKGGDVVIEILVGFHERAETVVGPIYFNMSDPDLFENIEKFLKDNVRRDNHA
jgi:hypothetical protein